MRPTAEWPYGDGVREALGVFDTYRGTLGREVAFARALVAYRSWEDRQEADESLGKGGMPKVDLDRWTPEGHER